MRVPDTMSEDSVGFWVVPIPTPAEVTRINSMPPTVNCIFVPADEYAIRPSTLDAVEVVKSIQLPFVGMEANAMHAPELSIPR